MKNEIYFHFIAVGFKLLPKFSDFINSDDFIENKSNLNLPDYIQFLLKKRFKFNKKKGLFLVKKLEIQVIIAMI